MPQQEPQSHEYQLRQIVHDLFGYLHAVGMGIAVLKSVREDEHQFSQVCDSIEAERDKVKEVVENLRALIGQPPG